jgi:hypothetical protein
MMKRLVCDQVRDRDLIGRYAAGTLGDDDAEALEAHLLECADCWAETLQAIELHVALAGSPPATRTAAPVTFRSRRTLIASAAAAVLVLAIGAGWYLARRQPDSEPVLRGTTGVLGIRPSWQADGALRLEWAPSPGAVTYHITLVGDAGGEVSIEAEQPPLVVSAIDVAARGDLIIEVTAENAGGEVIARGTSELRRLSRR